MIVCQLLRGGQKFISMSNDIFSALADPTRRKILELLAAHKSLPASKIHGHFQVSPQAISQHLKILREANMVHVEKQAQQRIYRLNAEAIKILNDWTEMMRQLWNRRLDTMEAVLKEELKEQKKKGRGFRMNQESKKQELVITRVFDLPVELVWKAWTDPELVMKWWGPEHYTSPSCKIDLREGGKYLFCMRHQKAKEVRTTFPRAHTKKIIPNERLEFTHYLSDQDGNILEPAEAGLPPDFPFKIDYIIDFKTNGNKTELVITEYGWTQGEMLKRSIIDESITR